MKATILKLGHALVIFRSHSEQTPQGQIGFKFVTSSSSVDSSSSMLERLEEPAEEIVLHNPDPGVDEVVLMSDSRSISVATAQKFSRRMLGNVVSALPIAFLSAHRLPAGKLTSRFIPLKKTKSSVSG